MINRVLDRGRDMGGLIRYLFGPGLANEHEDPRIVAAYDGLAAQGSPRFTEPGQLRELSQELDDPRALFGVEVKGGHVWHMTFSNPPHDRPLTDEEWGQVARAAAEAMGFTSASGRAPVRWIAVHHGRSTEGNDHIHVVANLVREDGTKASVWQERVRTARVAAAMEKQFGLTVVEGRATRSTPGYHRAEVATAQRDGRAEPAKFELARTVRAASVAARDEAEFVRRLRRARLKVRPRYAPGGTGQVVGYSVAVRPRDRGKTIWYGGGTLGHDLALPVLRAHWESDPESERAALAEWQAASGRKTAAKGGRETRERDDAAWERAAERIGLAVDELARVPLDDQAAWAGVARETAGVVASLAARLEGERPGPLARTADVLARSASTPKGAPPAAPPSAVRDFRGVGMVISQAAEGGSSVVGQVLLLRQIAATMQAIHRAHEARGEVGHAAAVARAARDGITVVHDQLNRAPKDIPEAVPQAHAVRPPAPSRQAGPELSAPPRITPAPRDPEIGR